MSEKEEMAERIARELGEHRPMIYTVNGLAITSRMQRWGITSMVCYAQHATITDAQGQQQIPALVADWLKGGE